MHSLLVQAPFSFCTVLTLGKVKSRSRAWVVERLIQCLWRHRPQTKSDPSSKNVGWVWSWCSVSIYYTYTCIHWMHQLEVTRATIIDLDYLEQIEQATIDDICLFVNWRNHRWPHWRFISLIIYPDTRKCKQDSNMTSARTIQDSKNASGAFHAPPRWTPIKDRPNLPRGQKQLGQLCW